MRDQKSVIKIPSRDFFPKNEKQAERTLHSVDDFSFKAKYRTRCEE